MTSMEAELCPCCNIKGKIQHLLRDLSTQLQAWSDFILQLLKKSLPAIFAELLLTCCSIPILEPCTGLYSERVYRESVGK